jgi:mannose-6-phosphate isomerase-like protein (cupin superfamily)
MSKQIETKGADGKANGWLLPLWNARQREDLRPEQVYLTVVFPGHRKGPHLHYKREQRYYCIRGSAKVTVRNREDSGYVYTNQILNRGDMAVVSAGDPSVLQAIGQDEAWVINMPSPAWAPDDQDEWPVEDWGA